MRGYVLTIIVCVALGALCLPSPRPNRQTVVMAVLDGDAAAVRAAAARGFDVTGDPSLLCFAAASGHRATVRALLELGANPNPTSGVVSPLIMAAANGHTDVVQELLRSGADPSRRNAADETAFELARSRGHADTAELLRRWQ